MRAERDATDEGPPRGATDDSAKLPLTTLEPSPKSTGTGNINSPDIQLDCFLMQTAEV